MVIAVNHFQTLEILEARLEVIEVLGGMNPLSSLKIYGIFDNLGSRLGSLPFHDDLRTPKNCQSPSLPFFIIFFLEVLGYFSTCEHKILLMKFAESFTDLSVSLGKI